MPTQIIDLDVVLDEPKRVKLSDEVYKLPAQIPVPLYLKIKARQEVSGEDADIVEELHQQVLELFQVHQPKMQTIPCGMQQLFEIIPTVYGPESAEGEAPPTNGRRGKSKPPSSRKPRRKASASST